MQITAPVTDYIRASILTTQFDKVIRGAAIPERIAEVDWRGVHIGDDTRNAGGAQVITGVGFTARMIIFFACDDDNNAQNWSIGFDDGTVHMCMYFRNDNTISDVHTGNSIAVMKDPANALTGVISAIGADGFTITWTLGGACACNFIYLCRP